MADEAAVPDDHRVHGSQAAGVRGDLVQVFQDELLAGMGDVQSVETQGAGALQDGADGLTGQAQLKEVDGPVEVAQALHVPFAFVHGRGE